MNLKITVVMLNVLTVAKPAIPSAVVLLTALLLVTYLPFISLALPR